LSTVLPSCLALDPSFSIHGPHDSPSKGPSQENGFASSFLDGAGKLRTIAYNRTYVGGLNLRCREVSAYSTTDPCLTYRPRESEGFELNLHFKVEVLKWNPALRK
ncbi:unnamed protein product, partial [Sphacelaria rigidula]